MKRTDHNSNREPNSSTLKQDPQLAILHFLSRFRRYGNDISGVAILALGLMTLFGIVAPQWTQGILRWWVNVLRLWFGWGGLWIALFLCGFGINRLQQKPFSIRQNWQRWFALLGAVLISLAFLSVLGGATIERAEAGFDGGRIGWGLAHLMGGWFLPLGLVGRILFGFLLLI
ncbi:MAG: hypothetical protein ACPL4H_08845, partial [Anaerolineales bacterium]